MVCHPKSSVASGSSRNSADAIAVIMSARPDAIVTSNHASQLSSVAVVKAKIATDCRRRQASHPVRARQPSSAMPKRTQVTVQWPAT